MRVQGWEERLADVVEAARHEPYAIGRHDCALFVLDALRAVTGIEYGRGVRGAYRTERGALRTIARLAQGGDLRAAVGAVLGFAEAPPRQCTRGDPLLYVDGEGQQHLGVCVGAEGAVLGPEGLRFLRLGAFARGWRIPDA